LCAVLQVVQGDAADVRDSGGCVVAHQLLEFGKAFGMRGDERLVEGIFPEQQVQDAVKQRDIGTRQDGQVQVGQAAGVGAPRIDDDDAHFRAACLGRFQAAEQHRVGMRHVRAGDQQAIGQLDVFVVAWRCIAAQAALVADHGAGHAQA